MNTHVQIDETVIECPSCDVELLVRSYPADEDGPAELSSIRIRDEERYDHALFCSATSKEIDAVAYRAIGRDA